jgi:TusA-related sulfurtransferase
VRKLGIDTRELAHPEPLEMAIKILQQLNEDAYLYMLHTKNPIPLLDLAQEQGYRTLSQENSVGDWEIVITSNKDVVLKDLLSV